MREYEQTASERGKNSRYHTVKENANVRAIKIISELNEEANIARNKERIEKYGNSGPYRNLGSDDRANGIVYNNIGNNDSEIKSYDTGYYINGEKRILAKLDKMSKEESYALGMYEHDVLGITIEHLDLLKSNDDYMAGYVAATLSSSNKKHR